MPNPKKSIVELDINGIASNDDVEIANKFKTFFIKSVEELVKNFQPVKFDDVLRELSLSFHIKEVNQKQISKVIMQLRPRIILGWTPYLLKNTVLFFKCQ